MFNFLSKLFSKTALPSSSVRNSFSGGIIPPDFTTADYLKSYEDVGWWHAVVFRIALGLSEVHWTLFDVSNRDKPKQLYEHPVLDLLHLCNPFQTSEELIALDTIYMECLGESFWVLNANANGEPAEIVLPYPEHMSVIPARQFPFVKGYVYGTSPDAVPLDVNQVIHFKFPNPKNQLRGLGQAKAIGINLSAERNADRWVDQFFYNSARPDGVIQFDYSLSDEQFEKLKLQWSEKYKGVSKAHQVALLEGGGKYVQIQNTVKDMDFPNLKQKNRDIILGVEGMPLSLLGITENVNKSNAEAGDYTFARWVLKPRLDWKKAKLNEQLLPKFKNSKNLKLGFEEIVPETAEQRRLDAESGMRAGYLTVNEARIATGKDPLPGNVGDVLLLPLNLIPTPIISQPSLPYQEPTEMSFKGYTQEQKQDIWNRFAQKTLRQEEAFKRVFGRVFDEQKKLSIDAFEKTGQLPTELQDEQTARRFEPVIEMVYSSGFEDALPKQADMLDERALEWIATRSLLLAKSINATTLEALRKELQLGFAAGESIQQLTKRFEGYFDTAKKWQAERIARTETITAANRGANDRYQSAGINKVEWLTSRDGRVCPECDPLEGQVLPIDEGQRPALHPNCLLPDNKVIPLGLIAISRAWYEGRAIEIQTRRGHRLTVTPNHPILTDRGFVKAARLHEGEYIISSDFPQRIAAIVNPNNNEIPSFIEDIWSALSMESDMLRATVPVSTIDFHGDASGFNGKVDIVYSDSFLRDGGYAQIEQHLSEAIFRERGTNPGSSFVSDSVTPFGYFGFGLPSDGIMSRCHKCGKFFRGHSFKSQQISVSPITGFDAGLKESPSYNNSFQPSRFRERKFRFSRDIPLNQIGGSSNTQLATRDAVLVEQAVKSRLAYIPLANKFLRRFASLITPDEITKIRDFQFSDHVYDLQSVNRLYHASGIIVKNCRCTILPIVEG